MPRRILIAYATRMGSTAEVAAAMAEVLNDADTRVDVQAAQRVSSVTEYDAVIVGSPIRGGAWLPEAIDFVVTHKEQLSHKPTAYFLTCRTLRSDAPELRLAVMRYLEPMWAMVPEVAPRTVGCFAGKLDPRQYTWWLRLMMRLNRTPAGDWRDWAAIRDWAGSLRKSLTPMP